jgi:hypothetical protein
VGYMSSILSSQEIERVDTRLVVLLNVRDFGDSDRCISRLVALVAKSVHHRLMIFDAVRLPDMSESIIFTRLVAIEGVRILRS